jgi:hypothetical protein
MNAAQKRKRKGAPKQIDIHDRFPVVQALERVARYGNCGIVKQHGDLKTE